MEIVLRNKEDIVMDLVQQIQPIFETIEFGLQLLIIFGAPIAVLILGRYFIKKESTKKVWLAKLITVVGELISLIPLIYLLFTLDDGIWMIFLVPLVILVTIIYLFPFVFPFVSYILCKKRRKQNESISWQITYSVIFEVLSVAMLILLLMKDRF